MEMSCQSQQCVSLINSTVFAEYSRTSKIFIILFKHDIRFKYWSISPSQLKSGFTHIWNLEKIIFLCTETITSNLLVYSSFQITTFDIARQHMTKCSSTDIKRTNILLFNFEGTWSQVNHFAFAFRLLCLLRLLEAWYGP